MCLEIWISSWIYMCISELDAPDGCKNLGVVTVVKTSGQIRERYLVYILGYNCKYMWMCLEIVISSWIYICMPLTVVKTSCS